MKDKNDNNNHLSNNDIVSIARLLLPDILDYYSNNIKEENNIVKVELVEKNKVKPSA